MWSEAGRHPFLDFKWRVSACLLGCGANQPCLKTDPYEGQVQAANQSGPQRLDENERGKTWTAGVSLMTVSGGALRGHEGCSRRP